MSLNEKNQLRDAFHASLDMARTLKTDGGLGFVGYGWCELRDEDSGHLKLLVPFANIITDTGDMYYAQKGIALIAPASAASPTALTGMQIGSGTTAVAKSGAGGAMVTLLAGQAFDSTGGPYPLVSNLGAGAGVNMVYKTTYAAGTGTGTVNEATITNGTIGTASTAANTIARVLTGAITKGAADSLAITWNHKNLGA